jgi:tetratricopeptide (TPR) repeat protein
MAEESPALHHLKLVKAYIDEARLTQASEKTASAYISEVALKSLSKAAEHLNKARELDPNEVLWVEDKPGDGKYQLTQDFLHARVLTGEGICALNSAHEMQYKNNTYLLNHDGKIDREAIATGNRYLASARDAFEKALKYSPAHQDALVYLSKTYRELGDKENYRRVLQQRVQITPDDMNAHKELDQVDDPDFVTPILTTQRFKKITLNGYLGLSMILGFMVILAAESRGPIGAIGYLMFAGPPLIWWYRRNY